MSEQAKQVAPLDLQAIKERAAKATPGPWEFNPEGVDGFDAIVDQNFDCICSFESEDNAPTKNDAEFMAHARTDIPALVAEVEKQTERANIAEMELNWLWRQVQEAHDLADTNPEAAVEKLRYVIAQIVDKK